MPSSGIVRAVPAEVRSKSVRYREDTTPAPKVEPRPRTPSVKRATFAAVESNQETKKADRHFGQVRTGHVNDKRNFFLRSASVEKLHEGSPGPRRRRLHVGGESWIRQPSDGPPARPGSSLGQAITNDQSVRNAVSGWSELSKSKSSAAVLQEEKRMRRALSKDRFLPNDSAEVQKSVDLSEAHTHQVQETVNKWGKSHEQQSAIERRVTTPTRHIGETFQENKVQATEDEGQVHNVHNQSAPWRTKNAEPSVKVVNVAVENNNNMRFSESAEALMAKHLKQNQSYEIKQSSTSSMSTTLMSSSSTSTMTSEHQQRSVISQPPPKSPGPARKAQTSKGKSSSGGSSRPSAAPTSPPPPPVTPSVSSANPPNNLPPGQKAVSTSSSGQVSMLSTTASTASSQEWTQQKSESTMHEFHESSMMMSTTNTGSMMMPEAPTLSEWLADEKTSSQIKSDQVKSEETKDKHEDVAKDPRSSTDFKDPRSSTDFLDARSKMLKEVASLRTDTASEDEEDNFGTSQEKAAERAKNERNRELAEIAEMRCRSNWQDTVSQHEHQSRGTPTKSVDPELEEARKTIRNAAAKWQEREQTTGQKVRQGTPPSGRTTPSRRIGNLFKKGSDHFTMEGDDEDLPPPPTDIEMEVTLPAPPPRESSKDVMMEYGGKRKPSQ